MRLSARVRSAIYAALLGILLLEPRVGALNETFYVDNTQGDCSDDPTNPGTSFATPLCTPFRAAQLTSSAGQRVEITSSLYRIPNSVTGLTNVSLDETTSGVTWTGMGDSPDDVRITGSYSTTVMGLTITKAPGYTNLWYFDPPATMKLSGGNPAVGGVGELGRWTDMNRPAPPAYGDIDGGPENGVMGYLQLHGRHVIGDHEKWRNDTASVSGTTVTLSDCCVVNRDQFSQYLVGKRMKLLGGYYLVTAVTNGSTATIDTNLGTIANSVSITTLTSVTTTATATTASAHGFQTGMQVLIAGASPTAYNGYQTITVTGSTTFTYTFAGGASPAGGTKTAGIGRTWMDLWSTPCPTDAASQGSTINCLPPDLDACLNAIDYITGSVCQDDAEYDSTWRVYFHPRPHHRLASLTSVGTTATGTCPRYCNYKEGESIIITGATPSAYNGTYTIDVVGTQETSQSFTYTFAGASGVSATGSVESIPDGAAMNLEFVPVGAGPVCNFFRDNTTVSNITCIAFLPLGGADSGRVQAGNVGTPSAWVVGGDNSHIHDIWSVGGRLTFEANGQNGGFNDFLLEDFFVAGTLQGDTSSGAALTIAQGFTIQDGEATGGYIGTMGWSGPYGSDNGANAAVFRRINFHEGGAPRRVRAQQGCARWHYDYAQDPVNTQYATGSRWSRCEASDKDTENGAVAGKFFFNTHGGGISTNTKYVNFYNNFYSCVSDYLGIEGAPSDPPTETGTVRIWNNTFRCTTLQPSAANLPDSVSVWNNYSVGLHLSGNQTFIESSGGNYYLAVRGPCPDASAVVTNAPDSLTLAGLQLLGLEMGSQVTCTTTLAKQATLFADADISIGTDSGGEDFRLVSGSDLIDNGDDSHCAITPSDGQCDIGAWEFGEEELGPALAKERFFIAGTSGGDSPPSNVAPVANAGVDQMRTFPETAQLNGNCNDTDTNTFAWTEFSGPGDVTFTPSATVEDPVAEFSEFGTYVLRLTCTDTGMLTDTDDVTITVEEAEGPNTAPNVSAGPDQQLSPGTFTATLDGTVTDNGTFSVLWEQLGGPPGAPAVSFGSTTSVDTTVTFPQPGNYTLRLNATDNATPALTTCDDINITVQSGPPPGGGSTPKRVRLRIKL